MPDMCSVGRCLSISLIYLCVSVCLLVVKPAERKPGGGESPSVGPDPDFDATESHTAGADHGKQRPVPRGTKTIHVKTIMLSELTPVCEYSRVLLS